MDLIISNASKLPIYEQITSQLKRLILNGTLSEGQRLPSIRALANELRVSIITTKRAYSDLETQGYLETVPGKGSFVARGNKELMREEQLLTIEKLLSQAVEVARRSNIDPTELREMIELLIEEP